MKLERRRLMLAPVAASILAAAAIADTTSRVSLDSSGAEGDGDCKWSGLSADARYVVFDSHATNLVPGDVNGAPDVFLHDRATGGTSLVSVDSSGVPGNAGGDFPSLSADGRIVAFSSGSTNLVPGDGNGVTDIFVRDLELGSTKRVSVDPGGADADGASTRPHLSSDGAFVAWYSSATDLVPGDGNGVSDVFVHDLRTGVTERASVDSSGAEADGGSFVATLSGDGRYVAFVSDATDLVAGDTNGLRDVFVRDRLLGTTIRVNVNSAGAQARNGKSDSARISDDGRFVAFYSDADNLDLADRNGRGDVFVHEIATGETGLVSVALSGTSADRSSIHPRISADGRFVIFQSEATDLVTGDTNLAFDVFLRDRLLSLTQRISLDSAGAEGDGDSNVGSLALDGFHATFYSDATNLVPGDTNGVADVFLRHLCLPAAWKNYGTGHPGTLGVPSLTSRDDPSIGTTVTSDVGDSTGVETLAVVLLGVAPAQTPTSKEGELLVVPLVSFPLAVPAGGASFDGDLPYDESLCGTHLYLQALELDAGALEGVSFSAGLELILGS